MTNTKSSATSAKDAVCDQLQHLVHEKQQEEQNARQIQESITKLESKSTQTS